MAFKYICLILHFKCSRLCISLWTHCIITWGLQLFQVKHRPLTSKVNVTVPLTFKVKFTTDVCGNKKPHSHNNVAAAAEVRDKLVKLCPVMGLILVADTVVQMLIIMTQIKIIQDEIKVNSLHQINNCFYCHNLTWLKI